MVLSRAETDAPGPLAGLALAGAAAEAAGRAHPRIFVALRLGPPSEISFGQHLMKDARSCLFWFDPLTVSGELPAI